jgi:predicted MFS family arabinose efflux permease
VLFGVGDLLGAWPSCESLWVLGLRSSVLKVIANPLTGATIMELEQHQAVQTGRWSLPGWRSATVTTGLFLGVDLLDELTSGFPVVALPLIREGLGLSYDQAGFLLTFGGIVAMLIEPGIFAWSDRGSKRNWALGGMAVLGLAWLLAGSAPSFLWLLVAFAIIWPACGVAVNLSQGLLIDLNPGESARIMTRWTFMGALGDLLAPLFIALVVAAGFGWRAMFWFAGGIWLAYALVLARRPGLQAPAVDITEEDEDTPELSLWQTIVAAMRAPGMLRWALLLESINLLDEVLVAFAALFLSDVIKLGQAEVSLALMALMAGGVLGLVALDRLLLSVSPRRLLPWLSLVTLAGLACLLLGQSLWLIIPALFVLGVSTAGLYPIMQAEAYTSLPPGRSGTVQAVMGVVAPLGVATPWLLGMVAEQAGLGVALALTGLAPIAILLFAPRKADAGRL